VQKRGAKQKEGKKSTDGSMRGGDSTVKQELKSEEPEKDEEEDEYDGGLMEERKRDFYKELDDQTFF